MLYFLIPLVLLKVMQHSRKIFLIYCVINVFLNFYPVSLLFFCLYLCLDSHTLFCVTFISPHLLPYLLILHLLSIITHPTVKIIMQHETLMLSPCQLLQTVASPNTNWAAIYLLLLFNRKKGREGGGGHIDTLKHEIFHIFIIRIPHVVKPRLHLHRMA